MVLMVQGERLKEMQIGSARAAKFFTDVDHIKYLEPFMLGESSLAQAADYLAVSKSKMSYWVKKLLELDLIYTVRFDKRAKHTFAVYRATADAFVVPAHLVPVRVDKDVFELDHFEKRLSRALEDYRLRHTEDWQLHYTVEAAKPNIVFAPPDGNLSEADVTNAWGELSLDEAQVEALHRAMRRVFETYKPERKDPRRKTYLFRMVLVEEKSGGAV